MGVKGLWSLLNPVARPVQIESMEGKRLAIDSSIWLYQFQATMRDKDGRVLVNAHVLGFLRRINKLLFHGIKPVFVFDGGAPVLKRNTIAERKRKRQGAVINHARTAERLFAAQMRREAVKVAQAQREQVAAREAVAAEEVFTRYDDDVGDQIAADATYLDDLENRPGPSRPRPPPPTTSNSSIPAATTALPEPLDPAEERRKKFRKMDPYRLPETSMPTVSTEDKPDARLATEEELKQFIDDMKPSDIDIESAEFRALPTEVQYEIIGDLRIRSRQQSHQRLAHMLRGAPTALDFSMAQIKHLSQRNALTQQLLTVTDMVGKAHLTIPVRIAAERNREYVLLKRGEDVGGGWALGIREGSKQKPIEVEKKEEEDSSEEESEESEDEITEVPKPVDKDLADFRRRQMLDAITARYAPKPSPRRSLDVPVTPFGASHTPAQPALFDDPDMFADMPEEITPTANDEALALALQQEELGSDEEEADPELVRALAMSRRDREGGSEGPNSGEIGNGLEDGEVSDDSMEEVELIPSERNTPVVTPTEEVEDDEFEEMVAPPTMPTSMEPPQKTQPTPHEAVSNKPVPPRESPISVREPSKVATQPDYQKKDKVEISRSLTAQGTSESTVGRMDASVMTELIVVEDDDDDMPIFAGMTSDNAAGPSKASRNGGARSETGGAKAARHMNHASTSTTKIASTSRTEQASPARPLVPSRSSSLLNRPSIPSPLSRSPSIIPPAKAESKEPSIIPQRLPRAGPSPPSPTMPLSLVEHEPDRLIDEALAGTSGAWRTGSTTPSRSIHDEPAEQTDEEEESEAEYQDDSRSIEWSRSPSPTHRPPLQTTTSANSLPSEVEADAEDVDMNAQDMVGEQDDYARFMAQIKNRNLDEVRTEIDDEIRVLHGQNKVAQRDSDEITLAMIAQIQTLLRHFGIPYITAPMEAEAQCAKLAELGLVDGIITDDSDVFLFGGTQCFKNIFNDNKYAECFLWTDINRELSLSRERLISLAYLLGSDYTIGLPGVGPVVALELLANFPGERGIDEFKEWWTRVQKGQDGVSTDNKWKASFKKRYSGSIFITADWPNPLVREAYKYPVTDESEEAFHWGFPKLSALRSFLHEELSWSISKVDDELTPIVQRIARRGKAGSLNKQSTLDPFFDLSAGALANYAPRKRTTANVSKRLMAVIKQFREAEAKVAGLSIEDVQWGTMMQGLDEADPKGRSTKKREGGEEASEAGTEMTKGKKRKVAAKPRRTKSGTAVSTESGIEPDGEEEDIETVVKPKRASRLRTKKRALSTSTTNTEVVPIGEGDDRDDAYAGGGEGDKAKITDISQVPVEERKKWRRQQQKSWRRAAVANSLKPN